MKPTFTGAQPIKRRLGRETFFPHPDGTPMVAVQLRNMDRLARMSVATLDRIKVELGPHLIWEVDPRGPHVTARVKGQKPVQVARFVLNAAPRSRLHYQDGDWLNLRESNVVPGLAPGARAPKELPPFKHNVTVQTFKADGYQTVGVRVEGVKRRARAERDAFKAHLEDFGQRPWLVRRAEDGRREVVFETACPGVFMSVAAALMGATEDERVVPKDGDYLNLRASNLERR